MEKAEKKKRSEQEKKKLIRILIIVSATICILAIACGLIFGLQPKKQVAEIENIPENCLIWEVKTEEGVSFAIVTGLTDFGKTVDRIIIPHKLNGIPVRDVAEQWTKGQEFAANKIYWQGVMPTHIGQFVNKYVTIGNALCF